MAAAKAQGWRVEQAHRGGHVKFFHPDGHLVTVASHSRVGDTKQRATRGRLRRAGLTI